MCDSESQAGVSWIGITAMNNTHLIWNWKEKPSSREEKFGISKVLQVTIRQCDK